MKRNKQAITERLVNLIEPENSLSITKAMLVWYHNIRPSGGFRLTEAGYNALLYLELEHWPVPVQDPKTTFTQHLLLDLDRKLQYPYYIDYKKKQLVFFSSSEAMLATLYKSIPDFLERYKV